MVSVNTEMTDAGDKWLLYDAQCPFCSAQAARFQPLLLSRGFQLAPLQTTWVKNRLGLPENELLLEMKLLPGNETVLGGADALLYLARCFWWAWPLGIMGSVPGMKHLLRALYRWGARHRYCGTNACVIPNRPDPLPDRRHPRNRHGASALFKLP